MRGFLVMLIAAAVAGCGIGTTTAPSGGTATGPSNEAAPLTILGAASLKAPLDQISVAWQAAHPGSTLTVSTDSSAALETQIEQGAPADVFLSADMSNPKKLVERSLADGPAVNIAANALTIVVPTADPAGIQTPFDLARTGVKVIAAGDDVPITTYANQVVANLARQPGYPPDFATRYAGNVVSKEDNVKAVVAKIELGEGDAGIVYVTDAKASTKVATVAIPDAANVAATYAGVVVRTSRHAVAAHAFLDWITGPEGHAILQTFGFLPPAD